MKRNFKNSMGITLIALVITIIILLILAGVGIQALTNTGLFEKAQLAKNKVKESEEIQNYTLAEYEQQIDSYTRSESSSSVKIYKLSELDSTYNPYGLNGFVKYDKSNELLEINFYYKEVNIPNMSKILNLDFIDNLPNLNFEGQDKSAPEIADYMAGTGITISSDWTLGFFSLSNNKNIYIHNTNGLRITAIAPTHCEMYLK